MLLWSRCLFSCFFLFYIAPLFSCRKLVMWVCIVLFNESVYLPHTHGRLGSCLLVLQIFGGDGRWFGKRRGFERSMIYERDFLKRVLFYVYETRKCALNIIQKQNLIPGILDTHKVLSFGFQGYHHRHIRVITHDESPWSTSKPFRTVTPFSRYIPMEGFSGSDLCSRTGSLDVIATRWTRVSKCVVG